MANVTNKQKKLFDAGSPGFLYTVTVSVLAMFAWSGVEFPAKPAEIAGEITTLLSGAYKKKALTFEGIFKSTLTWISLGNILFAGLALTGFLLPEGTVEQIVYAVEAKDWTTIISMLITTIVPAVVRFIKDKKQTT
jgi:hypothetical protein